MKKKNYESFPLSLALFDALPVIFFGCAMIVLALRFKNALFIAGAVLCALSGLLKVIWKIIIAASKKDAWPLNRQMRFVMPLGFLLVAIGVLTCHGGSELESFKAAALSFPSLGFFCVTVFGMILMGVFAFKLDSTKVRSNWIEQITNAIAQGCLLLGIVFAC